MEQLDKYNIGEIMRGCKVSRPTAKKWKDSGWDAISLINKIKIHKFIGTPSSDMQDDVRKITLEIEGAYGKSFLKIEDSVYEMVVNTINHLTDQVGLNLTECGKRIGLSTSYIYYILHKRKRRDSSLKGVIKNRNGKSLDDIAKEKGLSLEYVKGYARHKKLISTPRFSADDTEKFRKKVFRMKREGSDPLEIAGKTGASLSYIYIILNSDKERRTEKETDRLSDKIKSMLSSGYSANQISQEMGISTSYVYYLKYRKKNNFSSLDESKTPDQP